MTIPDDGLTGAASGLEDNKERRVVFTLCEIMVWNRGQGDEADAQSMVIQGAQCQERGLLGMRGRPGDVGSGFQG